MAIEPVETKREIVERPRNIVFSKVVPIGVEITANIAANDTVIETFRYRPVEPCSPGKELRCVIVIDFVEDYPAPMPVPEAEA
jgi:hypothetical protein